MKKTYVICYLFYAVAWYWTFNLQLWWQQSQESSQQWDSCVIHILCSCLQLIGPSGEFVRLMIIMTSMIWIWWKRWWWWGWWWGSRWGKNFELNVQGWAGAGLWARTRLFWGGTLRFVFVFKLCMWSHSNSGKVCRICFSCKLSCLFLLDQKLQFYKIPLSNFKRAWDVWQNCATS